ncbi:hypothetical protein GCM10009557_55740 [Virgisporangium ochraceum]
MKVRAVAVKVRTVGVVLTVVAAVVLVVAAAVDGPRRPPLELPAASAFPAGPCREVADPVLSLGRFTYENTGAERLPARAYPFLRQRAEQLAAVRDKVNVPGGTPPGSTSPGSTSPGSASPGSASPGSAVTGGAVTGGGTPTATPSADPAQQALSPRIDPVLTAIGFLRLRPGRAYDPALLRDLEDARSALQRACVSRRD